MSRYFNDCIGCEDRTSSCHIHCELYKEDKRRQQQDKAKAYKSKHAESEYAGYQQDISKRRKRK